MDSEWRKRSVLPSELRASPPPSSAQKVHAKFPIAAPAPEPTPARTSTPRTSTPKPAASIPVASTSKILPAVLPRTPQQQLKPLQLQLQPQPPPPPSDIEIDVDVDGDGDKDGDGDESSAVAAATMSVGDEATGMSGVAIGEGEGAGVGMGMERDGESDEIVRALEKGLPRWEGFEDIGWMGDVGHVSAELSLVFENK